VDEDQKRGITNEHLSAQLEAIQESLRDVPEIKRIVTEHSAMLDRLTATLGTHSDILSEHSADLREVKQLLAGQMEAVAELSAASHVH